MKPPQKFQMNQTVKVPIDVCDSEQAKIVGIEWGPDNHLRKKSDTWLYHLAENGRGSPWQASEKEIVEWQA